MIHLVCTFMVKEGKMDEYLAVAKKLRAQVLQETGCVEYTFALEYKSILGHQEKVNKNRLTLIEKWETKKDLLAHTQAPHMKEFGPKLNALRESVTSRVMVTA
ncbi:MAG: antibiotic biosynthesis monooxygenase [Spirochaetales bacterium]|jgi:quinol monooxygenase YgiN|nr:antibiotic biosynthesis monooxygenase [Spirochaetales bacterium]